MQDNINDQSNREEFLFQHLIAMFQTLALQQLGKLINPMTGESNRDLDQARITIDMLGMIREKTRGNLNASEEQILDKVLTELQMNYVTEKERKEDEVEGEGEQGEAQEYEFAAEDDSSREEEDQEDEEKDQEGEND